MFFSVIYMMAGGFVEQKVQDVPQMIVDEVKKVCQEKQLTFVQIVKAQTQVVNGINWMLEVKCEQGEHSMKIHQSRDQKVELLQFN